VPNPTIGSEHLIDLVASLSGQTGATARRALSTTDPAARVHDPLVAVASALVTLRRSHGDITRRGG